MEEHTLKKQFGISLLKKFFQEKSFVDSDIASFNYLVENVLQKIIEDSKEIEPTIIPHDIDEFKIRLDKIWITTPEITEADGAKRPIYPCEARLRKITYAAPIYLEVSAHINGIQRESFTTQIGNLPIMLKSKFCHLYTLSREDLIKHGEDPDDPGGYFVVNGSEKVLIDVEDLSPNRLLIEKKKVGPSKFIGKLFSERGSYKIPHTVEKLKDGIFYLTFTKVKRIPAVVIIKALGILKDEEIMKAIYEKEQFDEIFINLYEFIDIKSEEDALDYIAKKLGITQSKDIRVGRMREILHKYFFPHIGTNPEDNLSKALNLCKVIKKFILVSNGKLPLDDKDHYMNKRLKLSGDLLQDLIRVNLKVLINDLLYNFQRIVKRGKFPSIKVIIREKLLTSRIYSAMATGNWIGGRKGISQRMARINFMDTISHLQRVVSPLSTSQENFAARALHCTHFGKLCPVETPEGGNIGLRKNLSLFAKISQEENEEEVINSLRGLGLRIIK